VSRNPAGIDGFGGMSTISGRAASHEIELSTSTAPPRRIGSENACPWASDTLPMNMPRAEEPSVPGALFATGSSPAIAMVKGPSRSPVFRSGTVPSSRQPKKSLIPNESFDETTTSVGCVFASARRPNDWLSTNNMRAGAFGSSTKPRETG
jgi:hypothetical protein